MVTFDGSDFAFLTFSFGGLAVSPRFERSEMKPTLTLPGPGRSTGVLYLLAVLRVSTYWGLWLGLLTSVASAAAFNFSHIAPTGHFRIANVQNWVALGVYFAAAVVVSTLADAARGRALEAD